MGFESIRDYCLSFPHATEDIQWEHDLLFRVGGKIFAVLVLEPSSPNRFSFKCTPEKFAELIEREGIVPAPYVSRYHWVALQRFEALEAGEIKELVRISYDLVLSKLPTKAKSKLVQKKYQRGKLDKDIARRP